MTEKNKKENISHELEKAHDCLKSAGILSAHGQYADAVSRLYYYVYHSVQALLLTKGLEPKTHEGLLRLLGMHFIKPGTFEPSFSHSFARLMKYRGEADYNPAYIFTESDYHEFQNEAKELYRKIETYLTNEGYITKK